MLTERTCDIVSVRRRRPLSRTSLTIAGFDKLKLAAAGSCRKAFREKQLTNASHSNMADPSRQARPWASATWQRAVRSWFQQVLGKSTHTVAAHLIDLANLERAALETALSERGHKRFHARQIFQWIYKRGVSDISAMTDLSRELRATLGDQFTITTPQIVSRECSTDGTEKFLLRLKDGLQLESVFIPDTPAMTFCISTQVGCAMACAFCLTGKMGLVRNLTAGEIVGQVRVLVDALHFHDTAVNIVLMGMGEPLHNYDETMKALRILCDEHGFAL